MKILLTGASGMVGSNIIDHDSYSNLNVLTPTSEELNLLNSTNVIDYINKNKPDMIIHAAGFVGGIQSNINQPVNFLVNNLQMGINILMAAKNHGIKNFINLGSSCMYPRNAQNPLSEGLILQGELEPTNEGYAIAKVAITRLCEYINREDKSFLYKTVIPCNLYGKYDKFDIQYSHMIPAVIKKISDAYKGEFTHQLSKPSGMKQKLIDINNLSKFGWHHQTSLKQGIKSTYDYYLSIGAL